jgi:hypothetical protein
MLFLVVLVFEILTVLVLGFLAFVVFTEKDRFHEPPTALLRDPIGRQMVLAAKTGFWFWKAALVVLTVVTVWRFLP